jgi:hypothetical protein
MEWFWGGFGMVLEWFICGFWMGFWAEFWHGQDLAHGCGVWFHMHCFAFLEAFQRAKRVGIDTPISLKVGYKGNRKCSTWNIFILLSLT